MSFPEEREEEDMGSKREVELKGEAAYKSHEGSFGSSRDGEWGSACYTCMKKGPSLDFTCLFSHVSESREGFSICKKWYEVVLSNMAAMRHKDGYQALQMWLVHTEMCQQSKTHAGLQRLCTKPEHRM